MTQQHNLAQMPTEELSEQNKGKPKVQTALSVMGERLNVDPAKLYKTLKATVFKKADDAEFIVLTLVANEYNLNPLTKELYAFPAKGGGIVPVVSIDGWIKMANSHPQMDGLEFDVIHDDGGKLYAVTCRIYRKDRNRPTEVTEYLSECYRETEPWKGMPNRMLRHKALMQCARYAFGFSGVTDEDEAEHTPGMRAATGREIDPPAQPIDPFAARDKPAEQPEEKTEPQDENIL